MVLILATLAAQAWEFSASEIVSEAHPGVYHHLDPAGRRAIAVSGNQLAVTWEDNRSGQPAVYAAMRNVSAGSFRTVRMSEGREAYESVVAPIGNGKFAFAWEQDESVYWRTGDHRSLGRLQKLSQATAGQVSLDVFQGTIHAVWSERVGQHRMIRYARIDVRDSGRPATIVTVATESENDQLYPSVAAVRDRVWVAWEDRSHGHTRIMAAASRDGKTFETPGRLNELGRRRRQIDYGKGPGATRVALVRLSADHVAAAWLDKRDFLGGYDVYTTATDSSPPRFGPVRAAQDDFGKGVGQWHPAIAARPDGQLVAAWDDDRDGTADIQLAWREPESWSANLSVDGANGPGQDSSPVITFDEKGSLHLVWVERDQADGPTRLRYLRGLPDRVKSPKTSGP